MKDAYKTFKNDFDFFYMNNKKHLKKNSLLYQRSIHTGLKFRSYIKNLFD